MIQNDTPIVYGLTGGATPTGYGIMKADGSYTNGGGSIAVAGFGGVWVATLLSSETDQVGQICIIPDSSGHTLAAGTPAVYEVIPALPAVPGDAMALTSLYDAAKTAAQAGDAMNLDPAYDAAKTAAQAGDAMTLTAGERTDIANALLDLANGIEAGITVRKAFRAMAAVLAGKATVGGGHCIYDAAGNPGTARVDGTTPGTGARTAVTLTL